MILLVIAGGRGLLLPGGVVEPDSLRLGERQRETLPRSAVLLVEVGGNVVATVFSRARPGSAPGRLRPQAADAAGAPRPGPARPPTMPSAPNCAGCS